MSRSSRFARRTANRLVAPYVGGLAAHLAAVQDSVRGLHGKIDALIAWQDQQHSELGGLRARLAAAEEKAEALAAAAAANHELAGRDRQMLREIYERADEQRLRLYALRESDEYDLAFTEPEPLISYVVPTYDRLELLRERALPSILSQSYRNIEVIVAGDGSPAAVEAAIRELDDPRIRFNNRTVRGPYPDDSRRRWFMAGTPPLNDGVALARGRWIAILGDDDAILPNHAEHLLALAQERRLEFAYGRLTVNFANGEQLEVGKFPPRRGHFALQFSLYHAGLRFFQFEPIDTLYEEPNDWSLARRMLAAGVRFAMTEEIVAVKHESNVPSRAAWIQATSG